jgi:hypothetical protein
MVMGAQQADALSLPDQAYTDRLDRLASALDGQGITTHLLAPPGRVPSLRAVNPAAPALAEDVYAGYCEDGSWWFWWSWAERIAAVTDLDGAAVRIAHVLSAPH